MPSRYTVRAIITSVFLFASVESRLLAGISVDINPPSASVTSGQDARFTARVLGAHNGGVNWTITPPIGLMSNGYYVAPSVISAPQTVTLTAYSLEDPTQTGSAIISLMPSSSVTLALLSVLPSFAVLQAGSTLSFKVLENGSPTQSVTWSLKPVVGTIGSDGVYRAPASITSPQTVLVTAMSMSSGQQAVGTLSLLPSGVQAPTSPTVGISVDVMPTSASLAAGDSARFIARVLGAHNGGVTWSYSPQVGTMSNGYYLAPSTIPYSQTVILTASSLEDPSKTASVPILLLGSNGAAPTQPSIGSPASTNTVGQPPVSVQLSPSSTFMSAGKNQQFSATVNGSLNTAVTWSLVPQVGSVVNGLYTAPALLNAQANVTIMATSVADPTKTASAAITLQPATPVSVTLSPSSTSLTRGQSIQFSAAVSGSTSGVVWSLSPAVGSLINGFYTAPATLTTQQTVTVKATSAADPTKSASATVTLVPMAIVLSPSSISLSAGGSSHFSATVSGSLNTGVSWSITPNVGSIINGLYTAPTTISTAQAITLTATSLADPTLSARAAISLTPTSTAPLTVFPAQVSLAASQTQQFSASGGSGGIGGSGPVNAQWSISPTLGSISSTGLYTAPASISTQQNVVVTALSSGVAATATVTLTTTPSAPPPNNTTSQSQIMLPLEVIGANGTTVSTSFDIASGTNVSGSLTLTMQIHGLRFDLQASVQVNNSAWLPISSSTVSLLGLANAYGGIGGGFHTLDMTMSLPQGVLKTGTNNIVFRFNQTDGRVSGYRVLGFNIQNANGTQFIPASRFAWTDPNSWQPPSSASSDVAAGQSLWRTAQLTAPTTTGTKSLRARCMDCHAQDGRDLKYFNYSNTSIRARSVFHGLTAQQGDQIASYIRTLNVPNPGRPWNPPFQPGPGLDSQPVENWSAGAGLSAVLPSDAAMVPLVSPTLSSADFNPNGYANAREIAVAFQFPDWNSWLPGIHPLDAWPTLFPASPPNVDYAAIRTALAPAPSSASRYGGAKDRIGMWTTDRAVFMGGLTPTSNSSPAWANPDTANALYSFAQWQDVKTWEVNQEFGLEGMAQVVFGATIGDTRMVHEHAVFHCPQPLEDSRRHAGHFEWIQENVYLFELCLVLPANGTERFQQEAAMRFVSPRLGILLPVNHGSVGNTIAPLRPGPCSYRS